MILHAVFMITFYIALLFGSFSFLWAPYVFWDSLRRGSKVSTALRDTTKMILGAWTVVPILTAGFLLLSVSLIPACFVPLLGPLFAASVLKRYARLFNRVNRAFHVPGRATVRLSRGPRIPTHDLHLDSFGDQFVDATRDQLSEWSSSQATSDRSSETLFYDNVISLQNQPAIQDQQMASGVSWHETVSSHYDSTASGEHVDRGLQPSVGDVLWRDSKGHDSL